MCYYTELSSNVLEVNSVRPMFVRACPFFYMTTMMIVIIMIQKIHLGQI